VGAFSSLASPSKYVSALMLAVLLLAAPGCADNPSNFPFWLPSGPVVRTHARPPGAGEFADYDPHAVRLEVRPLVSTNPARTQHLVVATVLDDKNQPRRKRRVEWILEGVGSIVEVDERGYLASRGYKIDNRYAVTYTDFFEHTLTRGNADPKDNVEIGPGQTWCIVTSPVEGDTHLTVYAPEVHDWDHREVVATIHWTDSQWQFPVSGAARSGTPYTLTTNIYHRSERTPLSGYKVRYTVLNGGPQAGLSAEHSRELVVTSDLNGAASTTLEQLELRPGTNRIGVEVIRPPESSSPAIVLAKTETTVDWQGPRLAVRLSAPDSAVVDQEIPATITVVNSGQVDTRDGNVYLEIPPGMSFVRSDPPAREENGNLVWNLQSLGGGRQQGIQAVFRAKQTGTFHTVARAVTRDDLRVENDVSFNVGVAQLKVTVEAPKTSVLAGEPFTLPIAVTNPGSAAASNLVLEVNMEDELEAVLPSGNVPKQVRNQLASLGGNETRSFGLRLVAKRGGPLNIEVAVRADAGLQARQQITVTAQQPQLEINRAGPGSLLLNKDGAWTLRVRNVGQVPLPNAMLRERLPRELTIRNALDNGQVNPQTNEIVWNFGTLAPGDERIVRYNAFGARPTTRGTVLAVASAYPSVEQRLENSVEVLGVPALRVDVQSDVNPVQAGRMVNYTIRVSNQGTLAADNVEVSVAYPPDKLRAYSARGAQAGRVENGKITFPALNGLPPNQFATFQINAQALQPGDARLRVSTTALSIPTPLVQEEATQIIAPLNGAPAPGPRPGP
jgi:uncharacterized repeat protein (TIGR01451 family)